MKALIYAKATKVMAVLLFITCVTMGVLSALGGILRISRENPVLYSFEESFDESQRVYALLGIAEDLLYDACINARREEKGPQAPDSVTADTEAASPESERAEDVTTPASPEHSVTNTEDVVALLTRYLERSVSSLPVLYYVSWDGVVVTNCATADGHELLESELYAYASHDGKGNTSRHSSQRSTVSSFSETIASEHREIAFTVITALDGDYVTEARETWARQEAILLGAVTTMLAFAVAALLLLAYLSAVCGTDKRGTKRICLFDRVWWELHLSLSAGVAVASFFLLFYLFDEHVYYHFSERLFYIISATLTALSSALLLNSLLSIVRNLKCRRFVASSMILSLLFALWRLLRWICRGLSRVIGQGCAAVGRGVSHALSTKTGGVMVCLLLLYSLLTGLCGMLCVADGGLLGIFLFLGLLGLACGLVMLRVTDLTVIRTGARRLRGGETSHPIPAPRWGDLRSLVEDVNGIGQGLEEAVAARVKAERHKAELITNVSHDLKTPLTSIINYTELLAQSEELPSTCRDYVQIIRGKSQRLKNMTRDLFDISKAQSGNESVTLERLNVALLLEQALAEHDGEITASQLPFLVDVPKELFIRADGQKMSRVLDNLILNVLKYAMPHTRVFISVREEAGEIRLECKNVSAYPLDFKGEEIVGRFVRGDESRSTEGSGLGLAIVKSYTELCGGRLEIIPDGDLFKAILAFPPCPETESP